MCKLSMRHVFLVVGCRFSRHTIFIRSLSQDFLHHGSMTLNACGRKLLLCSFSPASIFRVHTCSVGSLTRGYSQSWRKRRLLKPHSSQAAPLQEGRFPLATGDRTPSLRVPRRTASPFRFLVRKLLRATARVNYMPLTTIHDYTIGSDLYLFAFCDQMAFAPNADNLQADAMQWNGSHLPRSRAKIPPGQSTRPQPARYTASHPGNINPFHPTSPTIDLWSTAQPTHSAHETLKN
jgi:hypothetical protein